MTTLRTDAVLAVYLDKYGREIQREVLSDAAKGRTLQDADPDFLEPYRVMTVEINCSGKDRQVFHERIMEQLGPPEGRDKEWRYTLQCASDDRFLRYVFDTNERVPLELFAKLLTTLTQEDSSRSRTAQMIVTAGCIYPCRPKICPGGKAGCGYAVGCSC